MRLGGRIIFCNYTFLFFVSKPDYISSVRCHMYLFELNNLKQSEAICTRGYLSA